MTNRPDATTDGERDPLAPTYEEFDDFELLTHTQANAQALVIATVAWLRERGIDPAEWGAGLGARFTTGWGEREPWPANEFLDAMLTNLVALGADVDTADLADETVAAATVTGLFPPEQCAAYGIDQRDALAYLDATRTIALDRGLVWEWDTDGDDVLLKVRSLGTGATG
jgi:hypothetical protein